jgi:hypothetical protein
VVESSQPAELAFAFPVRYLRAEGKDKGIFSGFDLRVNAKRSWGFE